MGELFSKNIEEDNQKQHYEFEGKTIQSKIVFSTKNEEIEFKNENISIKIPKGQKLPILANAATFSYEDLANRFPSKMENFYENSSLLPSMVDFTMFTYWNFSLENVQIEFFHDKIDQEKVCVFWDPMHYKWLTEGCFLSENSSEFNTICECDHLCNFGLLFGGSPSDDPEVNEIMDQISKVLGGISIACLVFTQIVTHFHK